ncbi:MAG: ribonuclease III [Gammaproteobacteria bacterium]|nr:MAG: ribonuclease III [Gammaproteobacteria bacterium]
MSEATARLCQQLGYTFADGGLLDQALTHRSAGGGHNERLEFLGDAALNFLIADALCCRFPLAREGVLTRQRAVLVNRNALAEMAREIDLGEHLHLGGGELKSGGRDRNSILGDACEALVGAIYRDGGLDACRAAILPLFEERLRDIPGDGDLKDPKTRLQELAQAHGETLPTYEVVKADTSGDDPIFVVQCRMDGLSHPTDGSGRTRRAAEQAAATDALKRLGED